MSEPERLHIDPIADCHPEIGRLLWQLTDVRQRTLNWVAKMDSQYLEWNTPTRGLNSISTLLYHLADVEVGWLYAEVLEIPAPTPEVLALLPFEPRDANGRLTHITGVSREQHLARLHTARGWLMEAFKPMSLEEFRRSRALPEYHVTPEWVVYHLLQHESEHLGEMMTVYTLAQQPQF